MKRRKNEGKTKRSQVDERGETLAEALRRLKGGTLPKRVEGKRGAAKISSKGYDRRDTRKR